MMWVPPHTSGPATTAIDALAYESADEPGRIMIVDDSREAGRALASLLELSNHTVELVTDGQAALSAVALRQPDLIILDVQLPGIDGYEVCGTLKHNPETWQRPIIMVTVEEARP